MLLSYVHMGGVPFLRSRTSKMLSEPTMKVKKTASLLSWGYLFTVKGTHLVSCNQLSDYPLRLIVLKRNPFLPKSSKVLFEFIPHHLSQAYCEPIQKSKTEHFAKIVNSWKLLTFFRKRFILDVWSGSKYASVYGKLPNSSISLNMSVRSPCYCKL